MRITHGQVELGAAGLGLEAHADERQLLLEALAHAIDHVVHQLTHGAAHGIGFTAFVDGDKAQLATFVADLDQGGLGLRQRATGTFDADLVGLDRDVHPTRDGHGHFSYARHVCDSSMS